MELLGPDLFAEEGWIRFYGVRIQTRMAVVRLGGDRLFLYSPLPLDAAVRRSIEALGEVAWVVSPNKIHNQTLADYHRAYPLARFYAPPGLPERRPEMHFDAVVGDEPEAAWEADLAHVVTRGNVFFSELLFYHRASRSLLVGDLVENLTRRQLSLWGLALARLFGVPGRPCASPEFRMYTHDAEAAAASLAPARGWDFDRIFLCHGELIDSHARTTFDSVCEELIARARGRGGLSRGLTAWLARRQ